MPDLFVRLRECRPNRTGYSVSSTGTSGTDAQLRGQLARSIYIACEQS